MLAATRPDRWTHVRVRLALYLQHDRALTAPRWRHDRHEPAAPDSTHRRRLGALAALGLGLFLGLTLIPVPLTGQVGDFLRGGLWQTLGIGALALPVLGIALALAGFDRLGSLDMKRAALLIIGPRPAGSLPPRDAGPGHRRRPRTIAVEHARSPGGLAPGLLRRVHAELRRRRRRGDPRLPGAVGPHPGDARVASAAAAGEGRDRRRP